MAEKLGDITVKDSGEVYIIEGKKYKPEELEYDSFTQRYYPIGHFNMIRGVIESSTTGKFVIESFAKSYGNIVIIDEKGNEYIGMDDSVLNNTKDYVIDNKGNHVHKNISTAINTYEKHIITKDAKTRYPYGAGPDIEKYTEFYNNMELKASAGANVIAQMLNGLSFGLEFETSTGLINKNEALRNGLIPLRDGSIDGLEYVTIPLEGPKGVQCLINAIDVLQKRVDYNEKCALHYHFGNIPRTEEFVTALWILITIYQSELYEYQPNYKYDNRGLKAKNYSKPLPLLIRYFKPVLKGDDLTNAYNTIIRYLSMDMINDLKLKDITTHPADPNGTQKWNVKTRYSIVNMIPLIFGNHKTVEFRQHEITLNREIVLSELLINATIIRFAKENTKLILEEPERIPANLRSLISTMYGSPNIIANLLETMALKRNDIMRSFKNGELFFNSTNKEYRQLTSVKINKPSLKKIFEIEFYKKHNNDWSVSRMGISGRMGVTGNSGPTGDIGNTGLFNISRTVRESNIPARDIEAFFDESTQSNTDNVSLFGINHNTIIRRDGAITQLDRINGGDLSCDKSTFRSIVIMNINIICELLTEHYNGNIEAIQFIEALRVQIITDVVRSRIPAVTNLTFGCAQLISLAYQLNILNIKNILNTTLNESRVYETVLVPGTAIIGFNEAIHYNIATVENNVDASIFTNILNTQNLRTLMLDNIQNLAMPTSFYRYEILTSGNNELIASINSQPRLSNSILDLVVAIFFQEFITRRPELFAREEASAAAVGFSGDYAAIMSKITQPIIRHNEGFYMNIGATNGHNYLLTSNRN